MSDFYKLTARTVDNEAFPFAQLKNHVVLIVNVASKCSFTPQYKQLEKLYTKYEKQGLIILGFPCNQFANQEPGSDEDIKKFCQESFGVTFPLMKKINVNGQKADPIYRYLKERQPGLFGIKSIKWNFEKFLIDKHGNIQKRYSSITKPSEIAQDIEELL